MLWRKKVLTQKMWFLPLVFHTERSWHACWFSAVYYCFWSALFALWCKSVLPLKLKLFMLLNDGFRLFTFLQSASWIWKIINDCIFVRKSGSGRVFSGFGIWPKYCAGIGKTINILTGSGIWLFPGKRDSPKVGHGMRDLCLRVCLECRKPSWPTGSSQWPKRINQASAIKWCLLSNQTPYGVSGY